MRYAWTKASGGEARTWRVLRSVSILRKLELTRLMNPAGAGERRVEIPFLMVYESRSIYHMVSEVSWITHIETRFSIIPVQLRSQKQACTGKYWRYRRWRD